MCPHLHVASSVAIVHVSSKSIVHNPNPRPHMPIASIHLRLKLVGLFVVALGSMMSYAALLYAFSPSQPRMYYI